MQSDLVFGEIHEHLLQIMAQEVRQCEATVQFVTPIAQGRRDVMPHEHRNHRAQQCRDRGGPIGGPGHAECAELDQTETTATGKIGVPELFNVELAAMRVAGRIRQERCQTGPQKFGRRVFLAFQLQHCDRQFAKTVARGFIGPRRLTGATQIIGREVIGQGWVTVQITYQPWQQRRFDEERTRRGRLATERKLAAATRVGYIAVVLQPVRR